MNSSTGPPAGHTQPFGTPTRTPRLLLRENNTRAGDIDGAWWPWTANLTAELHDLIAALTPRLGPITAVGFDWNRISRTQRHIDHDDGVHMHDANTDQPAGTMRLTAAHGPRATLLVIPFDTPRDRADNLMRRAARNPGPPVRGPGRGQ
ncbi:DUF5994 family protein [Nocardia wallacei]|uniref:Uncharacterized protein n=1 Tax=Nocardia wallacei TaxID=480035 RepID=A0A7G1KSM7_9NOCA|nr:DUF5994 family protein [Nocardia wallacei]BCK58217.1 hypothetical protein NWFMUON74_59890 [Nocardia wallacei]